MNRSYSSYYQAQVQKELCWLLTSTIRLTDHLAFDRCLDAQNSIFEFFVTPGLEEEFEAKMQQLIDAKIVFYCTRMHNPMLI